MDNQRHMLQVPNPVELGHVCIYQEHATTIKTRNTPVPREFPWGHVSLREFSRPSGEEQLGGLSLLTWH